MPKSDSNKTFRPGRVNSLSETRNNYVNTEKAKGAYLFVSFTYLPIY